MRKYLKLLITTCTEKSHFPACGGDPLVPSDVYLDGLAVTIPKWQGWAQAARNNLLEMTGELPISDRNDNQDIFPELSMETKINWINLCPVT